MSCATRNAFPTDNQNFNAVSTEEAPLPLRTQSLVTEFSRKLLTWSQDLAGLRQNWLLSESLFYPSHATAVLPWPASSKASPENSIGGDFSPPMRGVGRI